MLINFGPVIVTLVSCSGGVIREGLIKEEALDLRLSAEEGAAEQRRDIPSGRNSKSKSALKRRHVLQTWLTHLLPYTCKTRTADFFLSTVGLIS